MKLTITGQIIINASAEKVWRITAHEFANIGDWATAIPASTAVSTSTPLPAAPVIGRVCETAVSGFADITEQFTYYDEANMRFGYRAINGNPTFVKNAENNWQIRAIGKEQCEVSVHGEVDLHIIPGIFVAPLLKLQFRRLGRQTIEELKHFAENDQPHPRKLNMLQKQVKNVPVHS